MKPNKYQLEFINNNIKINGMLFDLSDKEIKKLMLLEKENRNKILSEIANIMMEYKVANDNMDLSKQEIKQLNTKLTKEIQLSFNDEITEEQKRISELLLNVTDDKYYMNSFNLALGLNFSLKKITSKELNRIINDTIDGKFWSDRLWTNKNKASKILKKDIKEFLDGKTSVNAISKKIKDLYNRSAFETKRLVQNETARVMEQVNEEWSKDLGIEYQMFMATLDSKTSEICRELDGKVYEFNDTNKPIPPTRTHIGCRSTLVSIPSKDWKPKKRLENKYRETIDYKTYKEWKEEQGL